MKTLQKRYIYSGVLAAVGFVMIYIILSINIMFSLLLTIIIYISGVLLFKEKDIRVYDAEDINRYHFQTSKLASFKERIKNEKIKESISNISDISTKILSALTQKPKKVTQVYNFYDYYMELLLGIVQRYYYLQEKKGINDIEKKFLSNTENYIDNIEIQFQKQLDNMYKTEILDIKREISLFENICHIEGLDKEIKEGEENV